MIKKIFKTEIAFVICIASIYLGFIWATFIPTAPYAVFVSGVTGAFAVVAGRRYFDNRLNGRFKDGTED